MGIHRMRATGVALTLVTGFMAAGCTNSASEPNTNPTPSVTSPTEGTTGPDNDPDPIEEPPETITEPPPLDPEAVQSSIDEVIKRAVDVDAADWAHESGLETYSYGDHYVDDSTGEQFDDTRIARHYASYESPGWAPGDDVQYLVWFEIVRLDTSQRADRFMNTLAVGTTEESSIYGGEGGDVLFEYLPEPSTPRPEFAPSSVVRGLRVIWPNGIRTDGVTGYETVGPYVLAVAGVAVPNEASQAALNEFLEDLLPTVVEEFRTLRDAP